MGGAIGAFVLVAIVAILVVGCLKRRRDLKHVATIPPLVDNNQMGPYELYGVSHVHELSSGNVHTLSSSKTGMESRKNNGLEEWRGS